MKVKKNFKEGDKVVMHSCVEAAMYNGKVWECSTDSFVDKANDEVVYLQGFSGSFVCEYLQLVNVPATINDMQILIHDNAVKKGFWEDEEWNFAEKIALIHSELSEALEANRLPHNKGYCKVVVSDITKIKDDAEFLKKFEAQVKNTVDDELADSVIRICDLAEVEEIALELHVQAKMRYNSLREYKHGKNY
ncbi:hypothetical protein [Draconibacterium sp.]|uniref:hypothetical protein n=1 Tax=Draconibacterium sp. TaxID=1965318 RepID=UPI0035656693